MKRLLDEKDEKDNLTKKNKSCHEDESMFSKPWQNSDAVLIVEGKELHVHTLIFTGKNVKNPGLGSGHFRGGFSSKKFLPWDFHFALS